MSLAAVYVFLVAVYVFTNDNVILIICDLMETNLFICLFALGTMKAKIEHMHFDRGLICILGLLEKRWEFLWSTV